MRQKTFAIIVALLTTLNIFAIELEVTGERAEGTILLQGNKLNYLGDNDGMLINECTN